VSDVYESTPNSGGYYHVNQTYWANGVLNQLSGLSALPTITYGVDGEGRIYSATASSGQNPLSSTTYNVASLPTQVNLGSSDSDSFTYDPNSDRMTEYEFTVDSQSVVGTLTWNAIATLASLTVTDPFNSSDAQTCSYSHDDLARIASVSCGSIWSQTLSYDAFGNINKSGTSSFQPTYSYLTNQMTQIGSSYPTYDANGNVTNDFLNTYAWDANGRPVTADSVGLTYDALGRIVEQNRSGAYTQIVYTPSGAKLALMTGSALQKGFVPLTGGSMAIYNSSGLAYYRHSDWIGSSRFASTPSRTLYFDGAYGPFGEAYASTGTTDLSFTGMNQDTAANLYDFPAREYGTQGRWPSPDPAGISSVRIKDPQTWNRYAYVRNNPLALRDPTGLIPSYCWLKNDGETGGCTGGVDLDDSLDDQVNQLEATVLANSQSDNSQQNGQATTSGTSLPAVPQGDPTQACYVDSYPASATYNGSTLANMSSLPGDFTDSNYGIAISNSITIYDQNGAVFTGSDAIPYETWSDQSGTVTYPDGSTASITPDPSQANQTVCVVLGCGAVGYNGDYIDTPVGAGFSAPAGSNPTFTYSFTLTNTIQWNGVPYPMGSTTWTVTSSAPGTGSISGYGLINTTVSRGTPP
jgi:RHS repeat-associated protein